MTTPLEVELPHRLGKAEARARIAGNTHRLADAIPGAMAEVHEAWDGDWLTLTVGAMGQEVRALIEVEEALVKCRIDLPGVLGMFRAAIERAMKTHGEDLLLEDRSLD
ncbi:polyhydroxyalkanoic acid system family protein [Sphingomicrobium astaxanthinifaciens]|uniref:polyhydroxyalkanoic acid system family protein n=1 Tax=Sphingomicrobium astaxanthinifaciens TaxID=1227949 RepID=UPI001FCB77B8|nr:polyhydroxyalkanoic acid system family protein [Sphingomicrobium astaxanthinifaciens]MCJ7421406.1 polyhydroxyalkanoic acid system family protein [Sphingomicrobium astaxanthinifaciens]